MGIPVCSIRIHGLLLRHAITQSLILIMTWVENSSFSVCKDIKSCCKLQALAFHINTCLKCCILHETGGGMFWDFISFETWISACVGNEEAIVDCAAEQQVVCCKTKRERWRFILVWRSTAMGLCKRCAGSRRIKKTEAEREASCEHHCLRVFCFFTEQPILEKRWKNIINIYKHFEMITNITSITLPLSAPTCLQSDREWWEWLLEMPCSMYFLGNMFSY